MSQKPGARILRRSIVLTGYLQPQGSYAIEVGGKSLPVLWRLQVLHSLEVSFTRLVNGSTTHHEMLGDGRESECDNVQKLPDIHIRRQFEIIHTLCR